MLIESERDMGFNTTVGVDAIRVLIVPLPAPSDQDARSIMLS